MRELGVEDYRSVAEHARTGIEHCLQVTFSTARVPKMFAPFVPERVTLDWETAWTVTDAMCNSTITIAAADPQARFTGTSTIRPNGDAVVWQLDGASSARRYGLLPSSLVERNLHLLLKAVLGKQVHVAARWLASGPSPT